MDRLYQDDELTVRLRGGPEGTRVHLEHHSGAALIVPSCVPEGPSLRLVAFDGTHFSIHVDDRELLITATGSSPLLGGKLEHRIPRAPDPSPSDRGVRVTGNESTMPIDLED